MLGTGADKSSLGNWAEPRHSGTRPRRGNRGLVLKFCYLSEKVPEGGKHGNRLENETQSKACDWNPEVFRIPRQSKPSEVGEGRPLSTSPKCRLSLSLGVLGKTAPPGELRTSHPGAHGPTITLWMAENN